MTDATNSADQFASRYLAARAFMRAAQSVAVKSADAAAIDDAARTLNLKRTHRTARLDDIRSAILADQVIFGVMRRNKTLMHLTLERGDHSAALEGWDLKAAIRHMRYRALRVTGPAEGIRLATLDVLRDEPVTLVDSQMSRVAGEGMVVAGRTLPFEDCEMFTGAAIPVHGEGGRVLVDKLVQHGLLQRCRESRGRPLSAVEEADLAALCIRTLLIMGADRVIRYADAQPAAAPAE